MVTTSLVQLFAEAKADLEARGVPTHEEPAPRAEPVRYGRETFRLPCDAPGCFGTGRVRRRVRGVTALRHCVDCGGAGYREFVGPLVLVDAAGKPVK